MIDEMVGKQDGMVARAVFKEQFVTTLQHVMQAEKLMTRSPGHTEVDQPGTAGHFKTHSPPQMTSAAPLEAPVFVPI